MNNNKIKTLIVDDELNACKNISKAISELSDKFEILAYSRNTKDARTAIEKEKPQLVFLDISMPNESGIDFLERIQPFEFEVVFVTAYSDFAIKALKLHAFDYILKPIDIVEFKQTILRLENVLLKRNDIEKDTSSQLILKNYDSLAVIEVSSILYLEAKGNYIVIYFEDGEKCKNIVSSRNIGYYENLLDNSIFIRTHKSYIVNKNKVQKLVNSITSPTVVLKYEFRIPIAIKKRTQINKILASA